MKQDELEKEAAAIQNEQTALIEQYAEAMKNNDSRLQDEISEKWTILCHQLKAINRRITLLKHQGC